MKNKRILSLALAVTMLFGLTAMLPDGVFDDVTNIGVSAISTATSGKCGDNISWSLKNGVLTISGNGRMYDNYGGFDYRNDITSVVIESGVTSIGYYAFQNCIDLASVTIPNSVTSIGKRAFYYCSSLKDIILTNGITSIENYAFYGCTSLESIIIPNSVTQIDEYSFYGCTSLTDVTLSNNLKSISRQLFYGCSNLVNITIPDSISSIGASAFSGCTSLSSVIIPDSVSSIGDHAFNGCTSLSSVIIPDSVSNIYDRAFWLCTSLSRITIPSSVLSIGSTAFSYDIIIECYKGSAAEKYAINNHNKYILLNDDIVHHQAVPATCTESGTIEYWEYKGKYYSDASCTKQISSIIESATGHKYSHKIIKQATCTSNGKKEYTCEKCGYSYMASINATGHKIASRTVRASCTLTGYTVDACSVCGLETSTRRNITCPKGHRFSNPIWNTNNYTITCSVCGKKETQTGAIYLKASGCPVKFGTLTNNTLTITGFNKDLWKTARDSIYQVPLYYLGKPITSISAYAYYGIANFPQKLIIPDNISDIDQYAFAWNDSIKEVYIGKGVNNLSATAFLNCNNIEKMTINSSIIPSTFEASTSLQTLTLGNTVKNIGSMAFCNCLKLKSVIIPWSVEQIGICAFGYYNGGLDKISDFKIYCYKGTAGEQYAIENGFNYELLPYTDRYDGSNRFETSAMISVASSKIAQSNIVVLANGTNYADALAGVPLATKLNAPILLTNKDSLPTETLSEISRLGASKVIILGGKGAVSANVEKTLLNRGLSIQRIAGSTRFETATKIASQIQLLNGSSKPEEVFLVYSNNFADALSVSVVAAAKGAPILYLQTTGTIDNATKNYLASIKGYVYKAYIIGGTGVISDSMLKQAGSILGVTPTRVSGKDRYETCIAVNNKFNSVLTGNSVCIATGNNFPDALSGGVFAALNKAPLFLVNGWAENLKLSNTQKAFLKYKSPKSLYVFGGTGVVPDSHIADIAKNSI